MTDHSGLALFYISVGTYTLTTSKQNYYEKSLTITCSQEGNPVYLVVILKRAKACFDCNLLDGWYYTTESYCNTHSFECGSGIRLRKEEYRDYLSICVDSSSQCKDYKVVAYRWVEDGYCYKGCDLGYCEEGFCRKEIKVKDAVALASFYPFREYSNRGKSEVDWIALLLVLILTILIFLVTKKRKELCDCP